LGGATLPVSAVGHTQIVAILPAGQGSNLPVIVSTAGGRQTSPLSFGYLPPSITSISPASGPVFGGTTITINGGNFGLTPAVTIGGKSALLVAREHGQVKVTLPAGTGGGLASLGMSVAGQSSNLLIFSYDPAVFSSWANSINWGDLPSVPGADPRHTGWSNFLSYAFGVNPLTTTGGEISSSVPPLFGKPAMTTDAQGRLRIGFWQRRSGQAADLRYQVQFGSDLTGGSWESATNPPEVEIYDDVWEYRTVTDHAPAGRRFGRLEVKTIQP
jgi:hypothetical protein